MDKIVDFILEKIKEDYCLIVGTDALIDNFSEEFKVDVNIMLMDYKDNDEIKTNMFKLYNARTKEIVTLGMIKKTDAIHILNIGLNAEGDKTDDINNVIGIELEVNKIRKSKSIFPIIAKTDRDKKRIINELLKEPKEEDFKMIREVIKKEKMKNEDEYVGYA